GGLSFSHKFFVDRVRIFSLGERVLRLHQVVAEVRYGLLRRATGVVTAQRSGKGRLAITRKSDTACFARRLRRTGITLIGSFNRGKVRLAIGSEAIHVAALAIVVEANATQDCV